MRALVQAEEGRGADAEHGTPLPPQLAVTEPKVQTGPPPWQDACPRGGPGTLTLGAAQANRPRGLRNVHPGARGPGSHGVRERGPRAHRGHPRRPGPKALVRARHSSDTRTGRRVEPALSGSVVPVGTGPPERPAAGRRRSASPVLPARSKPWPCFHRRGELRVDHVQNASCTVWRAVTISSERENGKPKIRKLPPAALRFRVTTEWTFVLGGGGSTQGGPGQRQEAPPGPGPHSHFPFCPSRGRLVRELGGNWRAEVAALGPGHAARSRAMHPPRAGV